MDSQAKRFLKVLLIVELFVIVIVVVPIATVFGSYKLMGWWGLIPSLMVVAPWLVAWVDVLKRY